jgi:hypothetical protein
LGLHPKRLALVDHRIQADGFVDGVRGPLANPLGKATAKIGGPALKCDLTVCLAMDYAHMIVFAVVTVAVPAAVSPS